MYDKYDRDGIERPGIYIEKDVKDTGEYVARGESVYVTKEDKRYIGKHVRFTTSLRSSDEERRKGKYMCVVVDPAPIEEEYYVLMDDESILRYGKAGFLEIDGLVSGHLISEQKVGNMTRRMNFPILEIVDVQEVADDDLLEKLSPADHTVEPSVSAEENGVTASLERIEYCDGMTRCYVRVDNESEWTIQAELTVCRPDGEEIGKPTEVSDFVDSLANPFGISLDTIQSTGESRTLYRSTEPLAEDEAFELHVKIDAFTGAVTDGVLGLDEDEWEITLNYVPEAGIVAEASSTIEPEAEQDAVA